jgi:putative transposase
VVFTTKDRRDVLTAAMLDRCEQVMAKVCADFDAQLVAFNGEDDHVHLLVNHLPSLQLSRLVNSLKGVSSRWLRQEFPAIGTRLWCGPPLVAVVFRRVGRWCSDHGAAGLHRAATPARVVPRLRRGRLSLLVANDRGSHRTR